MSITPHDLGTFLVSSESREEEHHICDLQEMTCSCEAFNDGPYKGQQCKHLDAALRDFFNPSAPQPINANPLLLCA